MSPSQAFFGRLIAIILLAFAVYSNFLLVLRNNKLEARLGQAEAQIQEKERRNRKLSLLISYYQSPSYQETEARRRLNLKRSDETAMIVKGISLNPTPETDTIYQSPAPEPVVPEANWQKWWRYFFAVKPGSR